MSIPNATLHNFLAAYFNLEELRTLCYELRIDYDDLGGEGKNAKIRELLLYCQRHNRMYDLVEHVRTVRPGQSWDDIPIPTSTFTNIWYSPRRYAFWEVRNPDVGTLQIIDGAVTYKGERNQLVLKTLQQVNHIRQSGSLNNNWVEVVYGDLAAPSTAYFAQGSTLGIGELVGGSDELFRRLMILV